MRRVQVFGCAIPLNVVAFFAMFAAVIIVNQAGVLAQPPWEIAADRFSFSLQRMARSATIGASFRETVNGCALRLHRY